MWRHKGSEVGEFKGKWGVKALSEQMWQEPLEMIKTEEFLLRVIFSGTRMHKIYVTYSSYEENTEPATNCSNHESNNQR